MFLLINYLKKYKTLLQQNKHVTIQKSAYISEDSIIGNYTYIGQRCYISKAIIGRYCSIAPNVSIGLGEHKVNCISTSSIFYKNPYEELTQKDCIIGNDVWIGVNSVIRRGIKIGDGAFIGACSFVNSDIPDFAIAVGTPAKVIKYRFSEGNIEKIKKSKWWDYELETAKKIIESIL